MAIMMHGAWTITAKSNSAAFAQRCAISDASFNNGPRAGTNGNSVIVTTKGS